MTEQEFLALPRRDQVRVLARATGCKQVTTTRLWRAVAGLLPDTDTALVRLRGDQGWQFLWDIAEDGRWQHGTRTYPTPLLALGVAILALTEELEDG